MIESIISAAVALASAFAVGRLTAGRPAGHPTPENSSRNEEVVATVIDLLTSSATGWESTIKGRWRHVRTKIEVEPLTGRIVLPTVQTTREQRARIITACDDHAGLQLLHMASKTEAA